MNDFKQFLVEEIQKQARQIETDMARGSATDFGDYKFHCGRHRGLLTVVGLIQEIDERMEQDDG